MTAPCKRNSLRLGCFLATSLQVILLSTTVVTGALYAADSTKDRIKIRKKTRIERSSVDNSKEFNAQKMALLAEKRRGLILEIKRFIRNAKDAEQVAELNMRLGALYLEDYTYYLALAQDRFERQDKAFKAGKGGKKPPKFDNSEATAALDRTRAIYRDLVQRYPKHERRDEMLYFLAVASLDRNQTKEAISAFKKLVTEFPNSKFAADALVQLGDQSFDTNDFNTAEGYYDRLIAKKHKPLLPYAVYKKAWCEYNGQRLDAALAHFKWVIQNEPTKNSDAPIRVRNEALRDITLPFVDLKLVDESVAFFKRYGAKQYRQGLETMSALYFEQGEYKNAVQLYSLLLRLDQRHPNNPNYEISIIESLKLSHHTDQAHSKLFKVIPQYLKGSNWYEINSLDQKVVQKAAQDFEQLARKYALDQHAEGQKTNNASLYNAAKFLYAQYIKAFPQTSHTGQIRFYLAEILYKQKHFIAAADQYYLSYQDPNVGGLKDEAIRAALTALDQQLNTERKQSGLQELNNKLTSKLTAKEDETLKLVSYSKVEAKFIEVASEYLAKYTNAKDYADVLYTQSYLRYTHHDLSSAYQGFTKLVQNHPGHATAISAAVLILDILNRNQNYPTLIATCKEFLRIKQLNTPTFRKDVADILRRSELKQIQAFETKSLFKQAADAYIAYTQNYGTQDEVLFEKALYNASVNYTKARMHLNAVESQEHFLRRFPKSPLRQTLLLQVAKTFETLAHFEKAAIYFEQFAQQYPKSSQAPSALRLAALYYWGSGNTQKAEALMLAQIKAAPRDSQVIERDLLDLYQSQQAVEKEVQFRLNARAVKGIPLARYLDHTVRIGELVAAKTGAFPQKLLSEAVQLVRKHNNRIRKSPTGVEAMAKLLTLAYAPYETQLYNLRLVLPQNALIANLQRKIALLKSIEKNNEAISKLGNPEWGLAAIYRTAAAYKHMADSVAMAPVPAELSAEEIETYRTGVERQMIGPFKEKARSLAVRCLDSAQELSVMSLWTSQCYALAGTLEPARYTLARTFYLPSVRTAILLPQKTAQIPVGTVKQYSYPFYSSALFEPSRKFASTGGELPAVYGFSQSTDDPTSVVPTKVSYSVLDQKRGEILKAGYASQKPQNSRDPMSFGFLNILRVTNPKQAQSQILRAIERDPDDESLHNLLGLAYLDGDNLSAARVTWLAMIARGVKSPVIWNNIGVVNILEGNEAQAIEYFTEGSKLDDAVDAWINLGFLALKYRNGVEARNSFERAHKALEGDAAVQIAQATAQVQNRKFESAKESLLTLVKQYPSDPYARLAASYMMIDVEKEGATAATLLADYINTQSLGNDNTFRQALREARRVASAGAVGELPSINAD